MVAVVQMINREGWCYLQGIIVFSVLTCLCSPTQLGYYISSLSEKKRSLYFQQRAWKHWYVQKETLRLEVTLLCYWQIIISKWNGFYYLTRQLNQLRNIWHLNLSGAFTLHFRGKDSTIIRFSNTSQKILLTVIFLCERKITWPSTGRCGFANQNAT